MNHPVNYHDAFNRLRWWQRWGIHGLVAIALVAIVILGGVVIVIEKLTNRKYE